MSQDDRSEARQPADTDLAYHRPADNGASDPGGAPADPSPHGAADGLADGLAHGGARAFADSWSPSAIGQDRLGPVRRVWFIGKSMSRTRCTGALVDALRRHGVDVRWRNPVTWRRWFGTQIANRLLRAEFRSYRPDTVFVFFRDLPQVLAAEFRRDARLVVWCEEALEALDASVVDYFKLADLVCMSNPARFPWLREHGLDNMAFLMSGFAPRYHRPPSPREPVRDVAFIGGPGRRGQRASFLARIARHFDTEVFGRHWDRWQQTYKDLRTHGPIDNRSYARVCATSRIVLGVNEVNDDLYYCSNRTFLTLACGAFHLTHYVPRLEDVFSDREHLVWYHDEDDALEKLAHWLPRDEDRARVAAGGHNEVMLHHQYYHRVARILHWLEDGLPREARELQQQAQAPAPAPAPAVDLGSRR